MPHFIKKCLNVNFFQDGFVVYNYKVIIRQWDAINPITDHIIMVYCVEKNKYVINFTTDDMRSKFEVFSNNKIDTLYLNEIIQTEWIQMMDELWDEGEKPYSNDFYLWA